MAEVTGIYTVEFTKVLRDAPEYSVLRGFDKPLTHREIAEWLESNLRRDYPIFDHIKVGMIQWFEFPDQPKAPKLTKREKEFCEFMKNGWIARDKEKNLYWYNSKPYKNESTWNNENSKYICMDLLNTPFAFIQWEDDEPCDVSELRKLEVEE